MSALTPWFKGGQYPRRAGVYRIRYWHVYLRHEVLVGGFAYWSKRKGWCQRCPTAKEAFRRNHYSLGNVDDYRGAPRVQPQWRGLRKQVSR